MSFRARTPRSAGKRALVAGAAMVMLCVVGARAQTQPLVPGAPTPDGLQQGELYMEADEVIRQDKDGLTTANGNIEVRYNGRTLRADRLTYDDKTGIIRASGNIVTINADGTSEFANEIVLDKDMAAGVALGFSMRLQDNVKIAAASAAKRSDNIQELNKAIYTPCEVCAADGTSKTPTWSIAADRVVRDKKRGIVYYRNAKFRLFGVSVGYLPLFWHADPESPRNSGFLVPKASASDRRGLSYEQPYYWAISPSADMTLSPQINTKVAPFLNAEVRKRFYSGEVAVRFGYTHERDFDGKGNEFGRKADRSYILGRGAFQIDDKWRWGFTAERTSDDLIFDKYEVSKVYESRGPSVADDRRDDRQGRDHPQQHLADHITLNPTEARHGRPLAVRSPGGARLIAICRPTFWRKFVARANPVAPSGTAYCRMFSQALSSLADSARNPISRTRAAMDAIPAMRRPYPIREKPPPMMADRASAMKAML